MSVRAMETKQTSSFPCIYNSKSQEKNILQVQGDTSNTNSIWSDMQETKHISDREYIFSELWKMIWIELKLT